MLKVSRKPNVSAGIAGALFFPVILYSLRNITSGISVIAIVFSAIVFGKFAVIVDIIQMSAPPICISILRIIPISKPMIACVIDAPAVPSP